MTKFNVLIGLVMFASPVAVGEEFTPATAIGLRVGAEAAVVASVAKGSPAARAGLLVGDRIEKVGKQAARGSYEALVNAIIDRPRKAGDDSVRLSFRVKRGGAKKTIEFTVALREIDVSVAVNRGLDFLAKVSKDDPDYKATRTRAFYAPIIYAPLAGLAFLANGSTRTEGRHAAAIRRTLAFVMKHGGTRKPAQDAINKAVGGNICSLTHNAGFSAMFLAQLLASESPSGPELGVSIEEIRATLAVCSRTLERIAKPNGGWQHGSGGRNMLGYTHLTAATITAMNGLSMARQVGIKVDDAVIKRGLAYLAKATSDGQVGYAVGNRGSFSAGRNAGYLQCLYRNGLGKSKSVAPVLAKLLKNIDKAGTGHGSATWHLFYVALASSRLDADGAKRFFSLYGKRLIGNQQADGSIRAIAPPGIAPAKAEENRVWGALYTTPLITMVLLAPYRQNELLYSFGVPR